jgi:mannose-1-phosphate guanylyltransferase
MRAVVLVGGFGTRLRPLTYTTPKPLLPIGRVAMLSRIVEQLGAGGIDEVVLALGFRTEAFAAAYPDARCGDVRLVYATEPEPLDTAGAIAFAARYAGIDETFVVLNGDVLSNLDIRSFIAAHRSFGGEATVHLTEVADPSAFGVAAMEGDRITSFVEKPVLGTEPSKLINAGAYVLEASVLDRVPDGARCSIEREIFPALAKAGVLYGYATSGYWLDTGRPDTFLHANVDVVSGARPDCVVEPVPADAVLAPSAVMDGSVVGHRCTIAERCTITNSVLLDGVVLAADVTVTGSIIGRNVLVGAGAEIDDCILGDHAVVGAGERLHGARRPAV